MSAELTNSTLSDQPDVRWLTADAEFKALAEKHQCPDGFSHVPESEARALITKHNLSEPHALYRYGWWIEGGNRWPDPDAPKPMAMKSKKTWRTWLRAWLWWAL